MSGCSRGVDSGHVALSVGRVLGCGRHGGKSTPGTSSEEHIVEPAGEAIGAPCRGESWALGYIVGVGTVRCADGSIGDAIGVLVTDPNTDRRNKSRTLSWTRDSRDGRASSTIPASKLLESGKGLRIIAGVLESVLRGYQDQMEKSERTRAH